MLWFVFAFGGEGEFAGSAVLGTMVFKLLE